MTIVQPSAQWTWATDSGNIEPTVTAFYGNRGPTKTGLTPGDLKAICGIPLVFNNDSSKPVSNEVLLQNIRWAEDEVEVSTGLLLTPTQLSSPPATSPEELNALQIASQSNTTQQLGIDYDLEDAAYDFFFSRARGEGWMVNALRYRPLRSVTGKMGLPAIGPDQNPSPIQNIAYIYPLLNQYFNVPRSWQVKDKDHGLLRLVPATNVQMLPLFAMQLAFMGFAESVPGGIWFQYTAGLMDNDYNTRYSFMKRLILLMAGIQTVMSIEGTISLGVARTDSELDGLRYMTEYNKEGPYRHIIKNFANEVKNLMNKAIDLVAGPVYSVF